MNDARTSFVARSAVLWTSKNAKTARTLLVTTVIMSINACIVVVSSVIAVIWKGQYAKIVVEVPVASVRNRAPLRVAALAIGVFVAIAGSNRELATVTMIVAYARTV